MVPALVFDLDGTLIDSLPDVIGALNELLAEEGRRRVDIAEGCGMVGNGAAAMVERAFAATGAAVSGDALAALTERYVAFYRATPVKDTIVYPGVVAALDCLAADGVPMGICTNKPHRMSRLVLDRLGLAHYFSSVIGGDALAVKKPDPGHVFAVLDEMNAPRTGAVFVGDSEVDRAAARNAGLAYIAVSYGYGAGDADAIGADRVIADFHELPAALHALDGVRNEA